MKNIGQKPCEDAISRQAVIDGIEELKKSPWATDKRGNGFEYLITEALDVVAELCVKQEPPIKPQPKTGHWIGIDEEPHEDYECNRCGYVVSTYTANIEPHTEYKYCPNCGAKMQEDKE